MGTARDLLTNNRKPVAGGYQFYLLHCYML